MAEVNYIRVDRAVRISRGDDGGAVLELGPTSQLVLPPEAIDAWSPTTSDAFIEAVQRHVSLAWLVASLWEELEQRRQEPSAQTDLLGRVVVTVADPELAPLPWEAALAAVLSDQPGLMVVRVSPVRPRVAGLPLSLPLRVLQVDPLPDRPIQSLLTSFFADFTFAEVQNAFLLETCALTDIEHARRRLGWPTADVLHFDHLPYLTQPEMLLRTAIPQEVGTLGWLLRLAESWQTRFIVVHCQDERELAGARQLATALIIRGGPAVFAGGIGQDDLLNLYACLVHDLPLELALRRIVSRLSSLSLYPTLAVGHGRAELLRIVKVAQDAVRLGTLLRGVQQALMAGGLQALRAYLPSTASEVLIERILRQIGQRQILLSFDPESKGIIPLGGAINLSRQIVQNLMPGGVQALAEWRWPGTIYQIADTHIAGADQHERAQYFVNAGFWREEKGQWQLLPYTRARLTVDQLVHLGIQIGPRLEMMPTIGMGPLLAEMFKWSSSMDGVQLEVGVTGLDFEVEGAPVQPLWLPRDRPSDFIYFAVQPRKMGVSQLRFCVYYQNNVLQSTRLAAFVVAQGERLPPKGRRQRLLATALDVPVDQVGEAQYLARVEYRLTSPPEFHSRPRRAVSFVANQLNGRPVITVKGHDQFEVREPTADLPDYVNFVREALNEVAGTKTSYPFDAHNKGTRSGLRRHLQRLAEVGWEMYDRIAPGKNRSALERLMETPNQIITAAQVSLYRVLPWAVVYDRPYKPRTRFNDDGEPVSHVTCLAPIDDEAAWNGLCGMHPSCVLHPGNLARRRQQQEPTLLPETVACPRHFWGFKHIIEVPPQQVRDGQNETADQRDCILIASNIRMMAGWNQTLDPNNEHWQALEALAQQLTVGWQSRQMLSHRILRDLKDQDLHLVYFYCHAYPANPPALRHPYLEFAAEAARSEQLTAPDFHFDQPWRYHPLVFINSCQSLGFRPDVVSPFVEKFVGDRGASGVIGTEIPVCQPLAWEMSSLFLAPFIAGKMTAGQALLAARRTLLTQKLNPLGLVYTLYAPAHLAVDRDDDGLCEVRTQTM